MDDRRLLELADALKRAYYFNELGKWRSSDEESNRWLDVAKVAAAAIGQAMEQSK